MLHFLKFTFSGKIGNIRSRLIFYLLPILFLLICTSNISAQSPGKHTDSADFYTEEGKRIYNTVRLESQPPHIDGVLDDPCWEEGQWSGNYRQFLPTEGADPSQQTRLKILYDEENIYVAIRAYDDQPGKIDRQIGRRDEFTGDIVGVCFDSYFDHRTGFEFDLTAAGSKIDLILMNDGWDTNWNAVWYGKTALEDSAWTAEFQIPLSQLRYGNKDVHTWGLHSWRWINRNQEEDQWNLMPRDNPGYLYSIGELHGLTGITGKRKIEVLPYTVGRVETTEKDPDDPYSKSADPGLDFGLDGKVGLSSDFTLDFTINPDFGQVEADPSVLNLSAFEVFYEEKRPFFLEGKNILDFDFGQDLLFYSRRIGHQPLCSPNLNDNEYAEQAGNTTILGAVKVTGKTKNGLSVGILESLTAKEKVEISRVGDIKEEEVVEPLTNYFVGRVQKDIKKGNTIIGGMFTSTVRKLDESYLDHLNREAFTGGVDFLHQWKEKTYYVDFKAVLSDIYGAPAAMDELQCSSARYYQRPDADYVAVDTSVSHLSGHGGRLKVGKGSNGRWRYSAGLNWRSPGLDLNDIGYLQIADLIEQDVSLGFVENEPKGIFRTYTLFMDHSNNWNFGGEYLMQRTMIHFNTTFKNKWMLNGSTMRQGRSFDPRLLRGGPGIHLKGFWHNRYSVSTDYSRRLSFSAGYHFHFFDDGVSGMNDFSTGVTWRPVNALRMSTHLMYTLNRDNYQYVDTFNPGEETRYLLATLDQKTLGMTIRADYAITPDFTIQYYGNPYISVGDYNRFKTVVDAEAEDPVTVFHIYDENELDYFSPDNSYEINEQAGLTYSFDNPDFNFRQFRSNLVARWEYKPGSTLFLVWTHGRSSFEESMVHSIPSNIDQLFDVHADNVFLLKFNYWFQI